jgi:hypothetical protein
VPLSITKNHTSELPEIGNTNMADEQTFEVGSTLAPLAAGPCSGVWLKVFGKYKTLL